MPTVPITLAESALQDLEELQDWYAEQGNPAAGSKLVLELMNRIDALGEHPDLGRVVPEFEMSFLRELIRPPFRIVYRRDANRVRVVRVWRAERQLRLPPDEA